MQQHFWIIDEVTKFSPVDTVAIIEADEAFIARLQQRLAARELSDGRRIWISFGELRNLRRIAGQNGPRVSKKHLTAKRIRVSTMKQWLVAAECNVNARIQALADRVTTRLTGKEADLQWDYFDREKLKKAITPSFFNFLYLRP